jgi:hypothetical protein
VLGQPDAGTGFAQHAGQCFTANNPRLAPQVLAIQFQQIEGVQERIARTFATDRN